MINYYNTLRLDSFDTETSSRLEKQFNAQSKQFLLNIKQATDEYEIFLTEFIEQNINVDIDVLYEEEARELWEATLNHQYRELTSLDVLETIVTSKILIERFKSQKQAA